MAAGGAICNYLGKIECYFDFKKAVGAMLEAATSVAMCKQQQCCVKQPQAELLLSLQHVGGMYLQACVI